jgi:potassium-transporting ATPase KdpC subunit
LDWMNEVEHMSARVRRLEEAILEVAKLAPQAMQDVIRWLQALRGVAHISAVTIAAELGNISSRFESAPKLMGYCGVLGSAIIGQSFTSDRCFHSRPSAAGNGYDATSSGGSNLGPTNKKLVDRIDADVAAYQKQNPGKDVPIDLVTTCASGLEPDISPAATLYQVSRVAAARNLSQDVVERLVRAHIQGRQFGVLEEPHVNVLELNLELD